MLDKNKFNDYHIFISGNMYDRDIDTTKNHDLNLADTAFDDLVRLNLEQLLDGKIDIERAIINISICAKNLHNLFNAIICNNIIKKEI